MMLRRLITIKYSIKYSMKARYGRKILLIMWLFAFGQMKSMKALTVFC